MTGASPTCWRVWDCNSHHGLLAENERAVAFPDAYPLSPGHALAIPRRNEADYFRLTEAERRAMWSLVDEVRDAIQREHRPQGYNLGVNVGAAAGQTIEHAHIHIISRCRGDGEDPRGGIRWVLPHKAPYWRD